MRARYWMLAGLGVAGILVAMVALKPASPPRPVELAAPISTEEGQVQGTRENGLTVYRGVPFAAPPVGSLRWRAPQAAEKRSELLQATKFKPACMQALSSSRGMAIEDVSEDCLTLNVWTPAAAAGEKLPVMVWLYGGGDSSGSGAQQLYWGDKLAQKGVVVVTLNYRVLAFGSLAHPELTQESGYGASGNYGLQDSIAALRWVQKNIAAFGGDPAKVTLFGQSAGAYKISKLMVSPLARGLFRRVIATSGGDFGPAGKRDGFPLLAQAEQVGVTYAEQFGAHSIAEMRKIPADKIVATDLATGNAEGVSGINRANIDGYVIPSDVYGLYADGKQADVDVLVGYTADEGANTTGTPVPAKTFSTDLRSRFGDLAERAIALFPAGSDEEAAQSQIRFHTADVAWRMTTWARLQSRFKGASPEKNNVFVFYFSRVPPFPPFKQLNAAGHGAELGYVFGFIPTIAFYLTETPWKAWQDARLVRDIPIYLTNFAKTGDPNGQGLASWPTFESSHPEVLEFGDTVAARPLPNAAALELLDAYYQRNRATSIQ